MNEPLHANFLLADQFEADFRQLKDEYKL